MRCYSGRLANLHMEAMKRTRFCMLTVIAAQLLVYPVITGFAQQNREVYTYNLTFTTTNQCMWQPGTCNIGYSYFLGGSFNGSRSGGGYFTIPLLGEFGASGSASASGRLGLNFEAYATGGDVSVVYPMQLTLSFPTREYLVPGGVAVIQSSYRLQQGARLSTTSPTARFVMSSVLDFAGSFSVRARAFSEDIINTSVNIPRVNYVQELVNTDNLNIWDRDFDLISNYPGLLTLNVHRPLIVTEGGNPFSPTETRLTSTGSDRFVTLTGDLTAATIYLIQTLLGVPPNNYLRKSISYSGLEAGYSLLQTEVRTGLGFRQDFEFVPRPKIRLTFTDGRAPVEFYAGESVTIQLPMSGALGVNASVVMDNQFTNITYLTISGGIYFLPLYVYASGKLGSISLGSFEFKPVDEMGIGSTLPISIFNRTFTLGGFSDQAAGALTVRANTDATPGIFYSVNYNSPTFARVYDSSATLYLECRPVTYFTSQSRVVFRGTELSTTLVQPNVVRAVIPASLLTTIGNYTLFVRTPGKPDTNALAFPVGYRQPLIERVRCNCLPGEDYRGYTIGLSHPEGQDLVLDLTTEASTYYRNGVTEVYWNDQAVAIEQLGGGSEDPANFMRIRVPNRYLWQPGTMVLKVVNRGPGGGEATYNLYASYPPLQWDEDYNDRLRPRRGRSIGTQGITIQVRGTWFIKGVTELILVEGDTWNPNNAIPLPTQYVSTAELMGQIPGDLMQTPRRVLIGIRHPDGRGGDITSGGGEGFDVLNPIPVVERCEPNVVNRGDAPPSYVEVRGVSFRPGCQIVFNGTPLATTRLSDTRLRFTLPAGTMNTGRVNIVKVRNPQTDGIDSNEEWFTVRNPAPTLTGLNPSSVTTFAPATQVDISGSGFESTARAYFGGTPVNTTFVSPALVRATIPAHLLRNAGDFPITVRNEPSIDSNALPFTVSDARIIYVSSEGNDANNGLSWATAKRTVQAGINAAAPSSAGGAQVWVKAGVYNERITLRSNVHVYGGFAGNETSRSQRNLFAHESSLDGQWGGTVATVNAGTVNATLDGFTLHRGDRPAGGGGVLINGDCSAIVISNNLIIYNRSLDVSGSGAGILVQGANPFGADVQILNNLIARNAAYNSAAVYLRYASAQLINNTIAYNTSVSASLGGGVYCSDSTNTLFANNIVAFQENGPGIDRKNVSTATVTLRNNCVYNPSSANYRNIAASAYASDINLDPRFVDGSNNNFHLGDSPCIDRGSASDAAGILVDYDGQARVNGVTIDIGADEVYAVAVALTVPPVAGAIRAPVNLTATLRRTDNNLPIAGQRLEFFVQGASIGFADTQSNGTATLSYTPPESLGTGAKSLRVEYAGNAAYLPASQTTTLTVNRGATILTPITEPSQVLVSQQMTLGGRLSDATGAPIANRTLNILWDGAPIASGNTDSSGVFRTAYTIPRGTARGNHTVRVEFLGDPLFLANVAANTVSVVNSAPEASLAGANLLFNGSNTAVQFDHRPELNAYPLTVSCWVRTLDTANLERGIVNKYVSGSGNGYQIYLRNGRVYAWYFRNGSNYIWDGGLGLDGGSIADGAWHHIQFTVDASGGRLYVDGVLNASRPWTGSPGACTTTTPLMIGRYPGTPLNGHFDGEIDEVKLWNRADVGTDEKSRKASLVGDETGLLAYFRFDECAGNQTGDAVSGGAATLLNTPLWQTSSAPVELLYVVDGVPRTTRLNAYDANEDTLSYNLLTAPGSGQWIGSVFPNATFLPPSGGISGAFSYRVSDGIVSSNTASGTIQRTNAPHASLGGSMRYFNGNTNSLISVPGFGNRVSSGELTIEFWQLVASPRHSATIDINGGSATNRIVVHSPWGTGGVVFDFGNWTTQGRLAYTPPDSLFGTWQHFAFVVSQSGNYMRIYRNGILEAQKTGMTPFTPGNYTLGIGFGGSGFEGFNGFVDEVRIWNRARTQREIQRDMHAVLQGNERGLIGYWRLDEWGNSATTALDSSPSGANGTFSNARWLGSTAPLHTVHVPAGERTFTLGAFAEYLTQPNQLTYQIVENPASGSLNLSGNQATYTPDQPGAYTMRYTVSHSAAALNTARVWLVVPRTGDVNGDGCVDDADMLTVLFAFGSDNPDADANGDGTVDDADLLVVLFHFGNGC
ncbi:Disaggregatase related [Armatimonadetes bacterium GBS]|nr:Disaggregatase related [Armatimonadetes bacterium GBS]